MIFASYRMCSSSVFLFMTLSAFLCTMVRGLSLLTFVRPVTLLYRRLDQQGGYGPPVAEDGLCPGLEFEVAPPLRDLRERAQFTIERDGCVALLRCLHGALLCKRTSTGKAPLTSVL